MAEMPTRRFSINYVGGPLNDDDFAELHDAVVGLFEAYGLKVEGMSDGPTPEAAPEATYTTTVTPTMTVHMDDKVYVAPSVDWLGAMRHAMAVADSLPPFRMPPRDA